MREGIIFDGFLFFEIIMGLGWGGVPHAALPPH